MSIVSKGKWCLVPAMLGIFCTAWGADSTSVSVNATGIKYSSSQFRNKGHEYGIDFGKTIGDVGIRASYSKSIVTYVPPGTATLNQNNYFLNGTYSFSMGGLPGKFTGGLSYLALSNNDLTGGSDQTKAYAPSLAYLNADGTLYLDLGYARSNYIASSTQPSMNVDQWTPTVGFGLNGGYDWVQLRGWLVKVSNAARAQGKSSTSALDMNWKHSFDKGNAWMPANVTLGAVVGERVYPVNTDAGSIGNLSDIQNRAYSFGATWNLPANWSMTGLLGQSKFQESFLGTRDYTMRFAFINVSKQW